MPRHDELRAADARGRVSFAIMDQRARSWGSTSSTRRTSMAGPGRMALTEYDHRTLAGAGRRSAGQDRPGDEGVRSDGGVAERAATVGAATSGRRARTACGGCRPTTSTSTRCTTSTGRRRGRRSGRRWSTLIAAGQDHLCRQQQLRRLAHRPGQRGRCSPPLTWAWSASRAFTTSRSRTVELEVLPACRELRRGCDPVEPAGGRAAGRRTR